MRLEDFYFKLPLKTEPILDDTTLRDGIQMPGLAVKPKDAAVIAKFLSEIGVERIEIFHYQEPDKKAVKLIQKMNLDLRVAGWCRAVKEDIDSAIECGLQEVGISHPVSDIHFKAKWPDKTREQILANVVEMVEYAAKTHGLRTFVHGEDSRLVDIMPNQNQPLPDHALINESLKIEINRALNTLSPRERDVLKLYYGLDQENPLTLEEIGEKFKLTRERVRQIKEKAIRRLKHASKSKALKSYLG